MHPDESNPYESPQDVESEVPPPGMAIVGSRRPKDEATLKQNTVCLVGLFVIFGLFFFTLLFQREPDYPMMGIAGVLVLAGLVGVVVYWGVRSFAPWARKPLTVLAYMGLPLFPFGTGFGMGILNVLSSRHVPRMLSPEYKALVKDTPEKNGRISPLIWIGIVLLLIVAGRVFMLFQLQRP